jgi:hypothetical protein
MQYTQLSKLEYYCANFDSCTWYGTPMDGKVFGHKVVNFPILSYMTFDNAIREVILLAFVNIVYSS